MILEVNLNYFIAQPEHYSVLRPHPFLDIYRARWVLQFGGLVQFVSLNQLLFFLRIVILLKIRFEVLEQGYFLLKFLREVGKVVLRHYVLFFICCNSLSLVIVELGTA